MIHKVAYIYGGRRSTPGAGTVKLSAFIDAFAPFPNVQIGIRKFKVDWPAPCM
jgi:hypothetical protein